MSDFDSRRGVRRPGNYGSTDNMSDFEAWFMAALVVLIILAQFIPWVYILYLIFRNNTG